MEFSVADAKSKLPELIKAVEDGESVTLCRCGVVDIVRTQKPVRKQRLLGALRGHIKIIDPDGWKPTTDKGVEDFLVGRYERESCGLPLDTAVVIYIYYLCRGTSRVAQRARGDRLAKPG
jgi:antitoxin (DNA-binding transcriptional repressor) of toxin-antitoxin stability system